VRVSSVRLNVPVIVFGANIVYAVAWRRYDRTELYANIYNQRPYPQPFRVVFTADGKVVYAGVGVVPPLTQMTFSAEVEGYVEEVVAQLRDPLGLLVIDEFKAYMY